MKKLLISDITLTSAKAESLSFKEKLEAAKRLDELDVDGIEFAPDYTNKTDLLLIRTAAGFLKHSALVCCGGKNPESVQSVAAAMAGAKKKRILINIPASFAQMEYEYHAKPDKILSDGAELIKLAKSLGCQAEAALTDVTRADKDFLLDAVTCAINAGADVITLADCAGGTMPGEFAKMVATLYLEIPALKDIILSVQCDNRLTLALACSLAAVERGAHGVKCTLSGTEAPSLDTLARALSLTGDALKVRASIDATGLTRAAERITQMTSGSKKHSVYAAQSAEDGFVEARDISGLTALIKKRGYDLSPDDFAKVFEEYQKLSQKKKVTTSELDVIIAGNALQVPPIYKLVTYVINSGNAIVSTASVTLAKDGADLYGLSKGDGPIDAAFFAIENITGHHYELDDFQIQAITEGREAVAEALVMLRYNGCLYSGRGVSTDIIGASIKAYLNALNKIVYEESM